MLLPPSQRPAHSVADVADVADVAGVALALYAAERIVRTHHILAAVQAAARFEDNAFRGCQTLP